MIHLDAGVVIGLLDDQDVHHAAAVEAVAQALDRSHSLAMSASAYAECLVAPSRAGAGAVAAFRRVVDRLPIRVVAVDADVAAEAAAIRAAHPTLRLPDALVIAGAQRDGALRLVTTDGRWPRVADLDVVVV